MEFPEWLRVERKPRGSQKDLAEKARAIDPRCGIWQEHLSDWEKGHRHPSLRQFLVLCQVMELDATTAARGRVLWDAAEVLRVKAAPARS